MTQGSGLLISLPGFLPDVAAFCCRVIRKV